MEDNTTLIAKEQQEPKDSGETSTFRGLSGRCWIAVIFAVGLNLAIILTLVALIFGNLPEGTSLTEFNTLITLFINAVTGVVGIYMGQNMKPKTP